MLRNLWAVAALLVAAGCGGAAGVPKAAEAPTTSAASTPSSTPTSSVAPTTSSEETPSEPSEPTPEPPIHAPPTYDVPLGPATLENLNQVAADVAPALSSEPDTVVGGTTVTFVFNAGALVDAADTCAIAVPAFEAAITEPVRVVMNYPDGATPCEPTSAATDGPSAATDEAEGDAGATLPGDIPADFPYRDAPLPDLPLDGMDRVRGIAETWSLRYHAPDRTEIDAYIAALQADPAFRPGMTSAADNTDMTQFLGDEYDLIVAVTAQNDGSVMMTANFTAKA